MLDIVRVPALRDNYIWLVHDPAGGETLVIDPAEAAPVLAAAETRGWTISQVWNTHWHPDHTGGNAAIKAATGARVTGPAAEAAKIAALDASVGEGDALRLGDHVATVMATPAHTAGHVSYHFAEHGVIFVGDTLFAMGCGRLFEGSAEQMFAAMQRYAALPGGTQVYCGHEYTQANGRYALAAEPGNAAIVARMAEVDARRRRGEATVPTTIAEERATNPFMRSRSAEELARRRIEKDTFAG
jgi:hydroxyacylglutathione hydrolase